MLTPVILLIVSHVIGDFILQGEKLSNGKWLNNKQLLQHVGIYTACLLIISSLALGLSFLQALAFTALNGVLHLLVDYITGKLKYKFKDTNERKYVNVFGIDQTIHLVLLIGSYMVLYPNAHYHIPF